MPVANCLDLWEDLAEGLTKSLTDLPLSCPKANPPFELLVFPFWVRKNRLLPTGRGSTWIVLAVCIMLLGLL